MIATTAPTAPTLCDLYLRLSDGRRENGSFVERETKLRSKAGQLGWTVARVVIENDQPGMGKSASAFKRRTLTLPDGTRAQRVFRPGFRSILDDLATGRANAILAEDLDRTMRDPRDAQDLIDVIHDCKGYAASLSGSLTLTRGGTDAEIMMTEVLVSMARKSSADTARRVTDSRERKAARGEFGGGRRPYGFTTDDGYSIVDSEAAEIVRAADLVLSGLSLKGIARDLNDREVPTVTGTRWSGETVRDILLRPLNAGVVVYQGEETAQRLTGEPILPEDEWRQVVARLTDPDAIIEWTTPTGKVRKMLRGNGLGRAPSWLLTGIARCVCGSVMEIGTGKGRAPAYRCGHDGTGSGTEHVRRNAAQLNAFIVEHVLEWFGRPDLADLFADPTPTVDQSALRREAKKLRTELEEWDTDKREGRVSRARWLVQTKAINDKLSTVDGQLAAATDRSPSSPLVGADDVRATWNGLSLGQQRAILTEHFAVRVLPVTRRGAGFDPDAVEVSPA